MLHGTIPNESLIPKGLRKPKRFLCFGAGCYEFNNFLNFLKLFEVVDMDGSFPMRCSM
jgi:hypothetical protein